MVEGDVKRVVVRHEGSGGGSSGYALEDGGLYFEAARGVEVVAHGRDDPGPLHEHVPDLGVDDEVDVSLAVAHLRVGEGVEHLSVLLLDYGEHLERLAQQGELLGVYAELAGLGDEGEALDSDYVSDVEKLLPHRVVHGLVVAGADFVALHVDLNASALVLELAEGRGSHYAAAHEPSGYAHLLEIALLGVVSGLYLSRTGVDRVFGRGVGFYSEFAEPGQRLPAQKFLFAVFHICVFFVVKSRSCGVRTAWAPPLPRVCPPRLREGRGRSLPEAAPVRCRHP